MSVHHYRLHDLTLRITRPRPWPPWVFQKLDHFVIPTVEAGHVPDIDVTVGPFDDDTAGMLNVDHRYFGRAGEISFIGRWNGVRYATRWSGLHGDRVKVSLHIGPMGLLRFPWVQQADWVLHLFVLKPITEWLWARRGRFVLHAAAAARDGRAVVFCGFGSSLKTSFVMQLVREGWELIGDDQVLLTAEGLLPLPIGLRTFDFRVNRLPDEYLTPLRTLRLGVHLLRRTRPRVVVASGPTVIGAVNLLTRTGRDQPRWTALGAEEAAARIIAQCRAESVQSVRSSPPTGEPLMALGMMDRLMDVDRPWRVAHDLLARQLAKAALRDVELTPRWHAGLMDAVALGSAPA